MKLKVITIATLIFLAMMALGAVSASENMTQDTEEMLEIADDSSFEIEQSVQEDLLGESEYTFTELNDKLNLNGSGTIILDGDYSYNNGSSTDGINISRELTIDGDGHKIDGKSKSKIFNIMEDNVVLNGITFVNARVVQYPSMQTTSPYPTVNSSTVHQPKVGVRFMFIILPPF